MEQPSAVAVPPEPEEFCLELPSIKFTASLSSYGQVFAILSCTSHAVSKSGLAGH